ncbi:MAG: amino acid racemase [Spirochaetia bacterium]|jgi:aspartate racemase|nr:amino acid racemase [Spirochaetia bacterium]
MKTIGVLGGMGPEATLEFFKTVLSYDRAEKDQDHLHIIIENNPAIPDRTAFILGKGADPLPAMLVSAERLKAAGADLAGIPCMTAHHFLPRIREGSKLRFISALETMAQTLRDSHGKVQTLGVLATVGSKISRLYESALPSYTILWPDENEQNDLVMKAIYGKDGIKAGNRGEIPKSLLTQAAQSLIRRGAQAIIAGCTEVPLALAQYDIQVPLLDPMQMLAQSLVREARQG